MQRCLYAHFGRGVPIFPVWIVKLVVLCTAWWYFIIVFLFPFFAVSVWTYLCFVYRYTACLYFKIMPLVEFYPNRVSVLVVWPCNFWSCWLDILGSLYVSGKLLIYPCPKLTLTHLLLSRWAVSQKRIIIWMLQIMLPDCSCIIFSTNQMKNWSSNF